MCISIDVGQLVIGLTAKSKELTEPSLRELIGIKDCTTK